MDAEIIELEKFLSQDPLFFQERNSEIVTNLLKKYGKRFVLFGAGRLGQFTLSGLRKVGVDNVVFADNNRELWNTTVDNTIVLSPEEAMLLQVQVNAGHTLRISSRHALSGHQGI